MDALIYFAISQLLPYFTDTVSIIAGFLVGVLFASILANFIYQSFGG